MGSSASASKYNKALPPRGVQPTQVDELQFGARVQQAVGQRAAGRQVAHVQHLWGGGWGSLGGVVVHVKASVWRLKWAPSTLL